MEQPRAKGPPLTLACSCAHLDRCPRTSKVIRLPEGRPSLHCVSSYSYRFHRERHQHVAKPLKAQSLKWRPKTPSQDIAHKATQLLRWPARQSASGPSKPESNQSHQVTAKQAAKHLCRRKPSTDEDDPIEGQVSAQVLNGSLPWQWVYILHIEVPTVWKKAPQYWSFQSRHSAEILQKGGLHCRDST